MLTTAPTIVEYRAKDHGFFEELVRLAVCLGSVGSSFELHMNGTARPFGQTDTIVLVGKPNISGLEIHVLPRPLFDRLLSPSSRQPKFLTLP